MGGHSAVLFFEYFWRTVAVVVEDEAVVVINDFGRAEVARDSGAIVEVEDGFFLHCPGAFERWRGCKADFSAAV